MSQMPLFERIHESFNRQALMHTLGAQLTSVEAGQVVISMPFNSALTQQHGFIHAGVVTTLVDNACGYAALSMMPDNAAVLTVEFKTNFISPAQGEYFIAKGRVLKPGKTLMVCAGDVFAVTQGKEKLIATMLATMIVREDTGILG
ncbi:MAG: hypothetical protein RLZZ422_841 [Pseudomonadota bacterium]|jgi:uncharacterized protein (TIGR00369 family)